MSLEKIQIQLITTHVIIKFHQAIEFPKTGSITVKISVLDIGWNTKTHVKI